MCFKITIYCIDFMQYNDFKGMSFLRYSHFNDPLLNAQHSIMLDSMLLSSSYLRGSFCVVDGEVSLVVSLLL